MHKLDLNSEEEKDNVDNIYKNAIDGLSEDDKKLPQVCHSCDTLALLCSSVCQVVLCQLCIW